MLIDEAKWLHNHLRTLPEASLYPQLDLGSGTAEFRQQAQPWIDALLFKEARERGKPIAHSDIQSGLGVDLPGDLSDKRFQEQLRQKRFRSIICASLLEYVPNPTEVGALIETMLEPQGYLLVTSPYRYPRLQSFDPDYRPNVRELKQLFPQLSLISAECIDCDVPWSQRWGRLRHYWTAPGATAGRFFLRLLAPFRRPAEWRAIVADLSWLWRRYQISCLLLRKGG